MDNDPTIPLYPQEYVSTLLSRIAELERITEGVDQLAIDGGWTARGMSEYAKSLEARLATPVPLPERYSVDCGVCADPNGEWLSYSDVVAALCEHKLLELSKSVADDYKQAARECVDDLTANRHDESNYPEIPEGCVVVPLVPTTEMIAAAMNSIDVTFDDDDYIFVHHDNIYAAMLAAAPKLDGCK